ncbi:MAG: hypothetical protein AAGJ83_03840, partial [Planctomycetota bacterium]
MIVQASHFQRFVVVSLAVLGMAACPIGMSVEAEDPVFSGPQVGESLASFDVIRLSGEETDASETVDAFESIGDSPVVLVFFHERTRPAFGLARAITRFAATKVDQDLKTLMVFLTDDPTETQRWVG